MFYLRRFDPEFHHRRSIRLKGYDYSSPGAYFITVCALDKTDFFGKIENGCMVLNKFGRITEFVWNDLPNHNPHISLDAHVIMPDHFHGIIIIQDNHGIKLAGHEILGDRNVGAGSEPAPTITTTKIHGLSEIVRQFKTFSARRINEIRKSDETMGSKRAHPVWQRNYYEHIIRSGYEIKRIRKYIYSNPIHFQK